MMQRSLVVTIVMLSSFLTVNLQGAEIEFTLEAPLQDVAPQTDGIISPDEYESSIFLSFVDRQNPGNPLPALDHLCPGRCDLDQGSQDSLGDDDLSATMYMGHTDEFLFFGFDVRDGFIDADNIGSGEAFQNDSVELFIDGDADGADGRAGGLEGFQIVADASNGAGGYAVNASDVASNNRFSWAEEPAVNSTGDPTAGEFYSAGRVHSNANYVIEFQIPLTTIDTQDGEGFTPAATGDTLRMNAVINDGDFEGTEGQDTHALLWLVEDDPRTPWQGAEDVWVVGLELTGPEGPTGDVDGDGDCDADDIDLLSERIRNGETDAQFDLNGDGNVDNGDRIELVSVLKNTWFGDANLDGEFNSNDLINVFAAGGYESENPAGWATGDWNGDGLFASGDLISAFADGGFENGPKVQAASTVPEPSALILFVLAGLGCFRMRS